MLRATKLGFPISFEALIMGVQQRYQWGLIKEVALGKIAVKYKELHEFFNTFRVVNLNLQEEL